MNKDVVTNKLNALLNNVELGESVVVNGDRYIPKGTKMEVITEAEISDFEREVTFQAEEIIRDLKRMGIPAERNTVLEILEDSFSESEDWTDDLADRVLTALL